MRTDLTELLPDLVAFVAVARARSFSRGAETLRMPVSTVSRRVAALEAKLGVPLLHRTTRQVVVTPEGSRYFEQVQHIVDALEAAHAELAGEALVPRGPLRISTTQDFALSYLLPVLTSFTAQYPDVQVAIDFSARAVDLLSEGIDVAIRMGALRDSQLHVRKLGVAYPGLYASPAYLDQHGWPTHPSDLAQHRCLRILGEPGRPSPWTFVRGRESATVEVQGGLVANGMRFLVAMAAAGSGLAILDELLVRESVERGDLVRALPDWAPAPVPVHALTASRVLPGRTRLFLDALKSQLQDHGLGRGGAVGGPE